MQEASKVTEYCKGVPQQCSTKPPLELQSTCAQEGGN